MSLLRGTTGSTSLNSSPFPLPLRFPFRLSCTFVCLRLLRPHVHLDVSAAEDRPIEHCNRSLCLRRSPISGTALTLCHGYPLAVAGLFHVLLKCLVVGWVRNASEPHPLLDGEVLESAALLALTFAPAAAHAPGIDEHGLPGRPALAFSAPTHGCSCCFEARGRTC